MIALQQADRPPIRSGVRSRPRSRPRTGRDPARLRGGQVSRPRPILSTPMLTVKPAIQTAVMTLVTLSGASVPISVAPIGSTNRLPAAAAAMATTRRRAARRAAAAGPVTIRTRCATTARSARAPASPPRTRSPPRESSAERQPSACEAPAWRQARRAMITDAFISILPASLRVFAIKWAIRSSSRRSAATLRRRAAATVFSADPSKKVSTRCLSADFARRGAAPRPRRRSEGLLLRGARVLLFEHRSCVRTVE